MRVYLSQVKIAALCASLLAVLAHALISCRGCSISAAAPTPVALTVENGGVYSSGGACIYGAKVVALRASDGTVLWQNREIPTSESTERSREYTCRAHLSQLWWTAKR